MNKTIIQILICLPLLILPYLSNAKNVYVREFGALPGDESDDAASINQAIQSIQPGDALVFETGTYDLWSSVQAKDKQGIVIRGQGATLMLRGFDRSKGGPTFSAIRVISCTNVVVQDFAIDMDVSPNSSGTIINVDDEYIDVRLFDEFPIGDGLYVDHIMTFYPDGRPNGNNLDAYSNFSVKKIDDHVLRIPIKTNKKINTGELLSLYHKVYGGHAIYFGDSKNCTLQDVTVYSFAGMGLVASDRTRDLTVERYQVKRPEGTKRLTSTNADGSKFIHTGGLLKIRDCEYEGMGDDAINIHSSFGQVVSINREKSLLQLKRPHRDGLKNISNRYLLPGDKVEFYDAETFLPKGISTVVQRDKDWFELDAVPKDVNENDLLNNLSMTPRVRISGVSVDRNRARGFLLQSQDVIVEDCKIVNPTGVGIFVTTDVNYWYESGPGKNVIIRNNVIEGANKHLIMEGAINVKCGHDSGGTDYPAGVHRNIQIIGNTISDTSGSGIYVCSTDGAVVKNNIINKCSINPKSQSGEYAIYLKNCKSTDVSDNEVNGGNLLFGSEGFE